jgi:phosphate transport system permease protein
MYSPERMVYLEKTSGAAVAVGSVGKQRSAIRSKKSGIARKNKE